MATTLLGIILAVTGVLVSWAAPSLTGRQTLKHPIIFSHLLERLTQLTIIIFGKTIVGIAMFFTKTSFSITSVLIFTIVASLFFTYITQFDHLIDEKRTGETGNLLIYLHYPIIFGLSMVTVALHLIGDPAVNRLFVITFLYAGLILIYPGIQIASRFNQAKFTQSNQLFGLDIFTLVLGYFLSLVTHSFFLIVVITTIVTMINCALLVRYVAKNR